MSKDNGYYLINSEKKAKEELKQFSEQLTAYIHWAFVGKLISISTVSEESITTYFNYYAMDKIDPCLVEEELKIVLNNISDCIVNLYNGMVLSLSEEYSGLDIESYSLDEKAAIKEKERIMELIRQELSPVYTKLDQMKPRHLNIKTNMDAIIEKLKNDLSTKKQVLEILGGLYRTAVGIHDPIKGITMHINNFILKFANAQIGEMKVVNYMGKFRDYANEYILMVEQYDQNISNSLENHLYGYLCSNLIAPWLHILKRLDKEGYSLNKAIDCFYSLYERTNDVTEEYEKLNQYTEEMFSMNNQD